MAYDEDIAHRIREAAQDEIGLTERKMFGGLGFMVNGNMGVAAAGHGGVMVRIDPADVETHLAAGAERMVMRGRAMNGWLLVDAAGLSDEQFRHWVEVGLGYARNLPAK